MRRFWYVDIAVLYFDGGRRWKELVDMVRVGIYPQHGDEYVACLLHCRYGKTRQSGHMCGYQFPGFRDERAEGGGHERCAVFAEVSVGGIRVVLMLTLMIVRTHKP